LHRARASGVPAISPGPLHIGAPHLGPETTRFVPLLSRPQHRRPGSTCSRHRHRTVRSVTRKSAAMAEVVTPPSNRSAAPSRSRARRFCSAGVYPPRCPYRMLWSYGTARPPSLPPIAGHYEFNLVSAKAQPFPQLVEENGPVGLAARAMVRALREVDHLLSRIPAARPATALDLAAQSACCPKREAFGAESCQG
jgi:hypothetical protein